MLGALAMSNWSTRTPVHCVQNLTGSAHANTMESVCTNVETDRCGRDTAALEINTRLVGITENEQSDHLDGTMAEQTRSNSSEITSPVRLQTRSRRLSRNKVTVK